MPLFGLVIPIPFHVHSKIHDFQSKSSQYSAMLVSVKQPAIVYISQYIRTLIVIIFDHKLVNNTLASTQNNSQRY